MTNAQSKMEMPLPKQNEVNKWCVDFASNYPRTQAYVQDIMVGEIELWKPELVMFVLVQATHIAMGFKTGKYDQRLKKNIEPKTREMFIDSFTYNYLKNATENINALWCACGDWDRVLSGVLSVEALKADCFVDRAINKYGDDKKGKKINVVITAPKEIQHIAEGLKRALKK